MIRILILVLALLSLHACASTMLPDEDNQAPIANAGDDLSVEAGTLVQLDGSQSYDPDGNELIFRWRLASPEGSKTNLSSTNFVETEFTPDIEGIYEVTLIVSDGTKDSPPTSVRVTVTGNSNRRPTASIAPVPSANVGVVVRLDGTESSDPDGDTLSFDWLIEGGPEETQARLDDIASPTPSFVPDLPGQYEVSLVVSDGSASSEPFSILFNVDPNEGNLPPIADPGANREVAPGTTVMLDGSRSTDPDGQPLTYSWSLLQRPTGSTASLTQQDVIDPSFMADEIGIYLVQLVVNDGVFDSTPVTVSIEAKEGNLAPLADAGPDQNVVTGATVMLNGDASSDPNGDTITSFSWTLSTPGGSSATLSNASAARPTFVADVDGSYTATLVVSDGTADSAPDSVTITAAVNNQPPVANAGADSNGNVGVQVVLDGRGSTDPNNDTLTYDWTLTTRPVGSSATLLNSTSAMPSFVPDMTGNYVLTLVVNDGLVDSAPDTVTITVGSSVPSQEGDLVLTELMINPLAANDDDEWIEFYNPTATDWQLQGCVLEDLGSDSHTISNSLVVPANTYVVLAKNAVAATNYDYVYSNFLLANGGDEVILTCGANEIANILYGAGFATSGSSQALLTNQYNETANDNEANWCDSTNPMANGDTGTPGAINEFSAACP